MRFVGLRIRLGIADTEDYLHAFGHPPKHSVLIVQPRGGGYRYEELTTISVGASVGHAYGERLIMLNIRTKLVLELSAPYTLTTRPRS